MNDGSLKTLFHPFEAGLVVPPGASERVLFLNAPPDFRLPQGQAHAVQDFRPAFLALEAAGRRVTPQPEGEDYDVALVLAGRHRGQNELWIAEALKRVRPGGRIVVAGARTDGAASLRKRIAAIVEVGGHASKNHGVAFWLTRPDEPQEAIDAIEGANPPLALEGGFITLPGLFSHDRPDPGSLLLAESLPDGIEGAVADFGAGWGFLSVALARKSPGIAGLDLYEASFAACVAAKANMTTLAPEVEARALWRDLLSEKPDRRYDAIVMNPPFHTGRAAEPSLGEAMIRAAAAALKPGGRLFLVANLGLTYETALAQAFARHGETTRDARFKVLWAVR